MKICGVDEAGRGPLAGPVVVASVIMSGPKIRGVMDSKKLTSREREILFPKIISRTIKYKISVINNYDIDCRNILKCCMTGMENCIKDFVADDVKFLIDGNYFKLPENRHTNYNFKTIIQGDDKIYEISCASILAKVTRDRIMDKYHTIFPHYNFRSHKGYATREHISNIKKYGICDIHRKTFLNNILTPQLFDEDS